MNLYTFLKVQYANNYDSARVNVIEKFTSVAKSSWKYINSRYH